MTACGGDDDDGEASGSTSGTEDETTTTEEGSDDDVGGEFLAGECEDLAEAFSGASAAIGAVFAGGEGDLGDMSEYFEEVADDVPEEIRDSVEVFAEAFAEYAEALEDAGIDFSDPSTLGPEEAQQIAAAGAALSTAEVQEASAEVQDYIAETCGE
jgi:hypothetical protein